MKVNFRNNILEIEDARIIYRNFSGEQTKFNSAGQRNFAVVIPDQETANLLMENGWNVKIKEPDENYETPFMFLKVKVKFNHRGPAAYVVSGDQVRRLDEDTIGILDEIDINSVDMDIRPFDWEVNGNTGRTAYLEAINVRQNIDRFGARYANDNIEVK